MVRGLPPLDHGAVDARAVGRDHGIAHQLAAQRAEEGGGHAVELGEDGHVSVYLCMCV